MREAREREEVEKYDRIKRMKANMQDSISYWAEQAGTRHDLDDQRKNAYVESSEQLYQGSEAMRKRNAAELEAFRAALAQRERELKERGEEESGQAYSAKQNIQADIQQQQNERNEEHASRTQDFNAAQRAQQDRIDRYAQANKQRSEAAREQVEQQEQSQDAMQERQNTLADRHRDEVERMKQMRDAREKQLRTSSLDREGNEQQHRQHRAEPAAFLQRLYAERTRLPVSARGH